MSDKGNERPAKVPAHDGKPLCGNLRRPVPQLPPQVAADPRRAGAIILGAGKWVNGTVLHYSFFTTGHFAVPKKQADAVRAAFAEWKNSTSVSGPDDSQPTRIACDAWKCRDSAPVQPLPSLSRTASKATSSPTSCTASRSGATAVITLARASSLASKSACADGAGAKKFSTFHDVTVNTAPPEGGQINAGPVWAYARRNGA